MDATTANDKDWGEIRVLLVEDEADSMDMLQETLLCIEGLHFRFHLSRNGHDALEVLRKEEIDLVIADILMPRMSGFEMLERMNELATWIPCIFVTSLQRRDAGIEALRLGAFDFIEKPLARDRIEEPIRKAIVVSRAFQSLDWECEPGETPQLQAARLQILKMRAMREQRRVAT